MEFATLAEGNAAPPPSFSEALGPMVPYFAVIAFLFYFMILKPQSKERRLREQLLANLKRNDRVVTYSGIIGTITGFSDDNKEVTLRVDDNVKLRFLRSAIQGPLAETLAATETPKPGAS
ncbi:MAG: preprotein translocase subunit YajC [Planctomycetaceae bacterium]